MRIVATPALRAVMMTLAVGPLLAPVPILATAAFDVVILKLCV